MKGLWFKLTVQAISLGVIMMTGGCMLGKVDEYAQSEPSIRLEEFFSGKIKAWGLIQDWRGRITTRFDVDMVGRWEGDVGTLEEEFRYYDGRTQRRVWTIRKIGPGRYEGEADDIIGLAKGATAGSAVYWSYQMDVPVDGATYRLRFDDWMWQMNDGIVINRSYLKKFGFTVAELTLFMQKQPDK